MATGCLNRRRLVLVTVPHPIHRVGQAFFMAAERREVQIVVRRVHHVEAAGEGGIGVEDVTSRVAIEHAKAWRFLDTPAGRAEIIARGA